MLIERNTVTEILSILAGLAKRVIIFMNHHENNENSQVNIMYL